MAEVNRPSNDYYTDEVCHTLDSLDKAQAIRAIHRAYNQLRALTENIDCRYYNNTPALDVLSECLEQAGHPGFPPAPVEKCSEQ